ncbi:hypothetical protein ES705_41006 [subsurface metagenome]
MKRIVNASLIVLFLLSLTSADIIHVPADTTSIQGGIYLAGEGDTVLVDNGTYDENIDFKGKAITVASNFIIDADTNHVSKTIIDGSQFSNKDSASVVYFVSGEDTTSVLCGFTITGGIGTRRYSEPGDFYYRNAGGIALYLSGGKIIHNKIINNHIQTAEDENGYGAGIAARGKAKVNLVIQHNQISNNTVNTYWGGGAGIVMGGYGYILCESNIISNNTFTANGGISGGGGFYIYQTDSGEIYINSNKIINNKALSASDNRTGNGGGLYIENCSPNLYNNIIAGNSAGIGGGLMILTTQGYKKIMKPVLINNTIIHNQAVIDNQTDTFGGGIYVKKPYSSPFTNPILINTIIWGNKADRGAQIYLAVATIDVAYSDVEGGWAGTGNIDVDPQFEEASFQLSVSSQCIGAGIATFNISDTVLHCPPTDIAGNPRPAPALTNPDIGAYEDQIITNIVNNYSGLPYKFVLKQNYPNPFNPKTVISYQLAVISDVELSIYSLLGQKVATLVSQKQTTGIYQVEWDARGFASGVYYYRINTGEFVDTKKLVLLR